MRWKLPALRLGGIRTWFIAAFLELGTLSAAQPALADSAVSNGPLPPSAREKRAGDAFVQASIGLGYLTYNQTVDGGYVVKGVGYDVLYSGVTYAIDASGGYFFSPSWGVGAELEYLKMPSPSGAGTPQGGGPTVERDVEAAAFFHGAGLLAFRPVLPLRLSGLVGYAGGNSAHGFGGTGPLLGLSADYTLLASGRASVSLGAEARCVFLSDPEHAVGNATKRAESGPMLSAGLRLSVALDFFGG